MNEIGNSIAEAIKKRATSVTTITYFVFWCAYHWQGIYTTLFTSEDLIYGKYNLLKNEYVNTFFFGWHGWQTLYGYILPLIWTLVFIWLLPPKFLIHAYRQEQRHKVDKRRVKYEEESKLEKAREELAVQEKKTIDAEIRTSRSSKAAAKVDPAILWEKEFKSFASRPNAKASIQQASQSVYAEAGNLFQYTDASGWAKSPEGIEPNNLALLDTYNLITFTDKGRIINFTDKGKYFLKKYSDINN
jgi:hypothetical protein